MTGQQPPSPIAALTGRWGKAFIIFYARDRWLALRRDDGFFLPADTLAQLETEMTAELGKRPLVAVTGGGLVHLAEYLGPELAARFGLTHPGTIPGQHHDGEPPGDDSHPVHDVAISCAY